MEEENNVKPEEVQEEVKQEEVKNEPPKKKKKGAGKIILILLIICALCVGGYFAVTKFLLKGDEPKEKKEAMTEENKTMEVKDNTEAKEKIEDGLSDFDLSFLKEENKKNMVYSPLSIKFCLRMLQDASEGASKEQIEKIVGDYKLPKYKTSENLSLANAFFVQNDFKSSVNTSFIDSLKKNYEAEVIFDSFASVDTVNKWISDKTFKIIENMLQGDISDYKFFLVNALAIDMDWNHKFLDPIDYTCDPSHENFGWTTPFDLSELEFDNGEKVSSMEVIASVNNYDIVKELGEDTIKEKVIDEYLKYYSDSKNQGEIEEELNGDNSRANLEKCAEEYAKKYIEEIDKNFGDIKKTTDFRYYVDDEYKVFAKDLKEYNGTTLEYIGIMPRKVNLEKFIDSTNAKEINTLIGSLKEISLEDSKEGVVTKISGKIPKFTYEYDLDLMSDLKKLGVTDVFSQDLANLEHLTEEKGIFIGTVLHKANIEFTQDGIKAAAATIVGGLGGAGLFDYYFDVPVEEIDITFDKPFMYIIRDKDTGEVWFVGSVNDPLKFKDDTSSEASRYNH